MLYCCSLIFQKDMDHEVCLVDTQEPSLSRSSPIHFTPYGLKMSFIAGSDCNFGILAWFLKILSSMC